MNTQYYNIKKKYSLTVQWRVDKLPSSRIARALEISLCATGLVTCTNCNSTSTPRVPYRYVLSLVLAVAYLGTSNVCGMCIFPIFFNRKFGKKNQKIT